MSQRRTPPFARPANAPDNPDFLEAQETLSGPAELLRAIASPNVTPLAPRVAPAPPPPAPERSSAAPVKPTRLSVFVTAEERWDIHERAVAARMTVNEYMHALLFPR